MYVAVDTVDEDYRFETLPHASGGDRKQLVERKLKQLYRSTPYFSATLQERDKDKRKDDRYLFCALTNPELLAPWLKAIEARELPLAGVYPLPTVTAAALAKLKLKSPNLLLISKHIAGLRQTFLKNGRFRITRLTQMRGSGDRTIDRSFAEEVSNTRMYLDALSVTTADETVQVVILDQDNSLASLREALNNGRGNLQCQRLTREELVLKLRIPAASAHRDAGCAAPAIARRARPRGEPRTRCDAAWLQRSTATHACCTPRAARAPCWVHSGSASICIA